jgi:hypothetical protein
VAPDSRYSSIQFRAFTSAGQLSFFTRVDAASCCDRLDLLVDGVQLLTTGANAQWTRFSVPMTLGIHTVEWRYQKDSFGSQGADAVWIDDVAFGP